MKALTTYRRPTRKDFQRAIKSMNTYVDVTVDDLMELSRRAEQEAFRRQRETRIVASVMSHPLITLRPEATMSEAAHLLQMHHISGLPVVDEDGRLAGILTEADFLRAFGLSFHHPGNTVWQTLEFLFTALASHANPEAPDDLVAEHMHTEVVTIGKEQQVIEVIELMKQHQVKRVVVCDKQAQAVGMVTRSDLIKVFFDTFIRKA